MKKYKLSMGDNIRIIAPSRSFGILSDETVQIATKVLLDIGFTVSFGNHIKEIDEFNSSSIKSRIDDLHAAFEDKSVNAILSVIGGFNSNQLINKINYSLIKKNPKIFCGYSDITALSNAIYAKTGLITYYGPHFSSFGMKKGIDYTIEYFKTCLMSNNSINILPSTEWSDDEWFRDQENRSFIPNKGFQIINSGTASGTLIGGNLCTFNLLQGTEFMPKTKNTVIMLEDDNMVGDLSLVEFDRNIQSLIELKDFNKVKGILIGRFQKASKINEEHLYKVLNSKIELKDIPIIANIDFGHTAPQVTLPIGGRILINTESKENKIVVLSH